MAQKPRKKKRIINFGLDITLLDHKTWKVPDNAMEALELLRKDSVIVIGSGRNMDHDMSVVYRGMTIPGAMIHMNGTWVVAGGNVLFERLMDKDRLRVLLECGDTHGIPLGVSQRGKDYYVYPGDVVRMDRLRWGILERNFIDGQELMDMPVRTLVYVGGPEGARELGDHFPRFKFPIFSGNMGADVVEQKTSEAEGLKRLCRCYDAGLERTVASGDSMSGYEIARETGIGIAMGDSMEELRTVVDCVTDDIDRDGIWKACRHFSLI